MNESKNLKMPLHNDYQFIMSFVSKYDVQIIHIECNRELFGKRFSSTKDFFRKLKNGLYSFNKISNRVFFKGISGVYLSLDTNTTMSILILLDLSKGPLNELQTSIRIKKLLGLSVKIDFPDKSLIETLICDYFQFTREFQSFGDLYFRNSRGNVNTFSF